MNFNLIPVTYSENRQKVKSKIFSWYLNGTYLAISGLTYDIKMLYINSYYIPL
ncbi:MAG: hypothetical protein ACJA1A_002284 [Saprospiraceae bacterium]|jgi:hypothetical protein